MLTYPILSADLSNMTHPRSPFKQHIPPVSHGRRRQTAAQAESRLYQQLCAGCAKVTGVP